MDTKAPNRKYIDNDIYLVKLTKTEKHREPQVISQIFGRSGEYISKEKLTPTILWKLALLNYVNIYTANGDSEHDAFMKAFKRYKLDISNPTEKAVNMTEFRKAMNTFLSIHQIDYDIVKFQSMCELITLVEDELGDSEPSDGGSEPEAHASNNTESGLLGEEVVFKLLKLKYETKYNIKKANEKNDFAGYDISIFNGDREIEKIEVKTVIINSNRFYISKHELVIAEQYPNEYYVYVLRYSKIDDLRKEDINYLKEHTTLLRIKNPIEFFGVDMDYVKKKITIPGVCNIRCKELEIDEINFNGFETVVI